MSGDLRGAVQTPSPLLKRHLKLGVGGEGPARRPRSPKPSPWPRRGDSQGDASRPGHPGGQPRERGAWYQPLCPPRGGVTKARATLSGTGLRKAELMVGSARAPAIYTRARLALPLCPRMPALQVVLPWLLLLNQVGPCCRARRGLRGSGWEDPESRGWRVLQ